MWWLLLIMCLQLILDCMQQALNMVWNFNDRDKGIFKVLLSFIFAERCVFVNCVIYFNLFAGQFSSSVLCIQSMISLSLSL